MQSPFSGMDPYLEAKDIWPSFHHLLADEIMALLNAHLSPRYYADVEVRTVLEEINIATRSIVYPDAAVLEGEVHPYTSETTGAIAPAPITRIAAMPEPFKLRTVQVFVTDTRTLVTAIEILSPINKRGSGLKTYSEKRLRFLQSNVHLIEIDLLRGGERPAWELRNPPIDSEYILLVNRASDGASRISEIWPVALNEQMPTLPVPLLFPDTDVPLDLTTALRAVYTRAAYERRIDYQQPVPPPALRPAMAAWWQSQVT